jgi:hypothetical protein
MALLLGVASDGRFISYGTVNAHPVLLHIGSPPSINLHASHQTDTLSNTTPELNQAHCTRIT